MLNPNQDRLDYGQVLTPPVGFHLDFAVGTTYSLDLDALVGACIALGLSEETDSALLNNPICLLEALRNTGDKVALFCEGGQIHLPSNVTPLYVLLEKMVFQISANKRRGISKYPSFHPKFWLLRYINDKKDVMYRVAVLSRNLTFDRSWDVTFCMDGWLTDEATGKNAPVCDFLSYLSSYAGDKKNAIRKMARELSYVHFELESKEFYDYDFIPVGIKSTSGEYHNITNYPLFNDSFHEVLIMSPFLSNGIIKDFNNRNPYINHSEYVLITRAMSLPKLKPADCGNFKIYTLKDAIVDGESLISEENAAILQQDIHAKIYMVRKHSDTDLYLGSLNASLNAISGNVEFMIRLRAKNRYLNLAKLTEQLFCGDEGDASNPFQRVSLTAAEAAEATDDPQSMLDGVVKELARNKPSAHVVNNGDTFEIQVHFAFFESSCQIWVSPLLSNKTAELRENIVFGGLTLTQLSEFYKITVSNGENSISRVLMIPTTGMPEDREKAIISGVINDKHCFYQYVAFLLGDDHMLSSLESMAVKTQGTAGTTTQSYRLPALYEKMLQTAANNPQKLKEIEYLLKAVSDDGVIPEQFEQMYQTFRKVVKLDD
jgi:HKD family nuclease